VSDGQRATLVEGPVRRQLVALTWPMIGGLLALMSLHFVDTWFVAQLGPRELAAMSFTFPVTMVTVSLGIGLMAGTSSVIARAIGSGDQARVGRLATDALIVSSAIAAMVGLAGLLVLDPLFLLLGAEPSLLPLIREYMVVWFAGFPVFLLPMVGVGAIRATGDVKLQSLIMVSGALANLALDPLLIFGLAGFPALGIRGAALATIVARLVGVVWVLHALHVRKRMLARPTLAPDVLLPSARAVLHVGVPAAGTNMIIPLSTAVVVWLLARHGEAAVAGFGAATRVESLALVIFYAMSSMIGPFVGQNAGAGRADRVHEALRECARFCALLGAGLAAVLALVGNTLVGTFSSEPEVVRIGAAYLLIVPIGYAGQGVLMVLNAALNGLGRPGPAMVLSTTRALLVYLPAAWLGDRLLGPWGIFCAASLTNLLVGLGAWRWWIRDGATAPARRSPAEARMR
jgi:putative MATE family efflux protein